MSIYFDFLLNLSEHVVRPPIIIIIVIVRDRFFFSFVSLSFSLSLPSPSLFFFIAFSFTFKFIRTHNTRARNAFVWRRVRGDSPSMTFALLHFLLLPILLFFFSRHYSTHCGCAYFLSRGSPTQIAIVLSWWCFAVMMVGASFQIFAQVRVRARARPRVVNCRGWNSCNWRVLLLNRSKLVDATFAFDAQKFLLIPRYHSRAYWIFYRSIFILEILSIYGHWFLTVLWLFYDSKKILSCKSFLFSYILLILFLQKNLEIQVTLK